MTGRWRGELAHVSRFGVVGLLSTALHLLIALSLVAWTGLRSQEANLVAFACAVLLSFFGHYHWSFRSRRAYRIALPRFVLVTSAAYLASAATIQVLSAQAGLGRMPAVLTGSLAIPAVSYIASRLLVFR